MSLLSMTGQGGGRVQVGSSEVSAEVRAVNNRHLKVHCRAGDVLAGMEPQLEALVRKSVGRGSIQLNVQVSGDCAAVSYRLRPDVIQNYWQQSQEIASSIGAPAAPRLDQLMQLPGCVAEIRHSDSATELDPELSAAALAALAAALECFNKMRGTEGESMCQELKGQLAKLREHCGAIGQRRPEVVQEYTQRLQARVQTAIEQHGGTLESADLSREIVLMADKSDIREELVRLQSHFDQFESLLVCDASQGRKLDFLIQELFREANTIGAKAADAAISQRVVDIKTTIEQMRELVQNVE